MDKRLPLFFSDAWISNQDDFKKQEVREGDENDDCPFAVGSCRKYEYLIRRICEKRISLWACALRASATARNEK
jgi:hypothetical protein